MRKECRCKTIHDIYSVWLGRAGYSDCVPRRLLGTRSMLRHAEWREAVTRLLLDALT
jgi:hypothetical protein